MFFGPNLGTRNAKNQFGPLKVPKCNQNTAKLNKIYVILMAPVGLKGRSGKNADVSKTNFETSLFSTNNFLYLPA